MSNNFSGEVTCFSFPQYGRKYGFEDCPVHLHRPGHLTSYFQVQGRSKGRGKGLVNECRWGECMVMVSDRVPVWQEQIKVWGGGGACCLFNLLCCQTCEQGPWPEWTLIILCGAHLKNVNPLSVENKPGSVRKNWDLISNHPLKNKISVCWGCVWKPWVDPQHCINQDWRHMPAMPALGNWGRIKSSA